MSDLARGIVADFGESGCMAAVLPASRLALLRTEIAGLAEEARLNAFQRWIIESRYDFASPDPDLEPRSVILVASPVPPWARVSFAWKGLRIPALSLVRAFPGKASPEEAARNLIEARLAGSGYRAVAAPGLPLKRLAARSGIVRYGRNNLCYAEGMGSFISLDAFLSDLPAPEVPWAELEPMEGCRGCAACERACPTGAILPGRFLIDNERCLSRFNEGPGEFPAWMPRSVHHSVYDCLLCQMACPADRALAERALGPFEFEEGETEALLAGRGIAGFSPEARKVAELLGLDGWPEAVPRNLRVLIENWTEAHGKGGRE